MKATEAKLLDFLKKSPQFVIPIYQRTYSWTEKECKQLWDDIVRTGTNDNILVHFVGSIVYIEEADSNVTTWEPLLVIDGQQRLTTVTLLIAALAKALGDSEPLDGFSAVMLRGYYLQNPLEKAERKYKLILSQTDRTTLTAIVGNHDQPKEHSLRVTQNFNLFEELIAGCGSDLVAVCKGLVKLMMVDIKLKRGEDNPQLIFESMNSTGKELSQADLIRNYILMGLEPDLQTQLYEQFWRPMEIDFGQEAYSTHFDAFMRHFLTVKASEIPRLNEVYEAFKIHACSPIVAAAGVEALVKDIRDFARHFCAMALGTEPDVDLKIAFDDLRELKVDVAYPLLLELYRDYVTGDLSKEDFVSAVRWVESYVFRRAVCAIPTNSMNKTFATFSKALKKERYLESIAAHFLLLPSYRRFPSDDEFKRDIQTRDLYNFRSRSYWLRRFENHEHNELMLVEDYTIEHILPQNEALSADWQAELGPEWQRIQQTWLHTLGNLTLTGYNSEYRDFPFYYKRDQVKNKHGDLVGFAHSHLRLNKLPFNINDQQYTLGNVPKWTEDSIIARSNALATKAVSVWHSPKLDESILGAYKTKQTNSGFTIDDHPYLSSGSMKDLFNSLRQAVLDLDPCVNEEFLKLYVAYKAETNFLDVVPQAKRLRLSLNMTFAEISDPKGLCKDVTDLGRWGNGGVEVGLSSLDELPYVIGLVRQALEKQLGDSSNI